VGIAGSTTVQKKGIHGYMDTWIPQNSNWNLELINIYIYYSYLSIKFGGFTNPIFLAKTFFETLINTGYGPRFQGPRWVPAVKWPCCGKRTSKLHRFGPFGDRRGTSSSCGTSSFQEANHGTIWLFNIAMENGP
jgi:hypothetical protein